MRLLPTLGFLGLALVPAAAGAFCRTTTNPAQPDPRLCPRGGVPLAWPGSCANLAINPGVLPATLTLAEFRAVLTTATESWAAAVCTPDGASHPAFRFVPRADDASPPGYLPFGANVNSVLFEDHWADDPYHPADAAAVTVVTYNGLSGAILDADTELNLRGPANLQGFTFSTTGDARSADLQTVVTHELGHTQGLAHSPERDAVMWYSEGPGEQRRALTADDAAGICAIYPPTRSQACDPDPVNSLSGGGCAMTGRTGTPGAALAVLAALAMAAGRRVRKHTGA